MLITTSPVCGSSRSRVRLAKRAVPPRRITRSTWRSTSDGRAPGRIFSTLLEPDAVEGTWFDRKLEYNARLQGKEPGPRESASTEEVVLSQLPCWRDLAPEAYRSRVAELVREIEESAAAARRETGREPLGEESVRAQDPDAGDRSAAFPAGSFSPGLPFVGA